MGGPIRTFDPPMPVPRGIDVQAHHLPPSYLAAIASGAQVDPNWGQAYAMLLSSPPESKLRTFAGRVEEMKGAGIRLSVVSVPTVLFPSQSLAEDAARSSNVELVSAASADPEHFRVLASLPLPFPDSAVAELERVAADPLVAGLIVPAATKDWNLDHPRFRPVLAAAAAHSLPVMLHPAAEALPEAFDQWRLAHSVAAMVQTTVAALRLVLSGALDEHPDLSLIVPHLGGVIPYLTQRLADQSGRGEAANDLKHYLRGRLFYDNCSFHPPALRCAVETVGASRIMLGSDYPVRGELSRCVVDVEAAGLDPASIDSIIFGTAESVLRGRPRSALAVPRRG